MKPISIRNSARQRNPLLSMGNASKKVALLSVSKTQVAGLGAQLWLDSSAVTIANGTAMDSFPARVGTAPTAAGAKRAGWTDKGLLFAGAQSYTKASTDFTGGSALTLAAVYNATTDGILAEVSTTFYSNAAPIQTVNTSGTKAYSGMANSTIASIENIQLSSSWNAKTCIATSFNRAGTPGSQLLSSRNGVLGTTVLYTTGSCSGNFSGTGVYFGSRGGTSVFLSGLYKAYLVLRRASTQNEVLEINRMLFWSVK